MCGFKLCYICTLRHCEFSCRERQEKPFEIWMFLYLRCTDLGFTSKWIPPINVFDFERWRYMRGLSISWVIKQKSLRPTSHPLCYFLRSCRDTVPIYKSWIKVNIRITLSYMASTQICPVVGTTTSVLPPHHPHYNTSDPEARCPVTNAKVGHHDIIHDHPSSPTIPSDQNASMDAKSCPHINPKYS